MSAAVDSADIVGFPGPCAAIVASFAESLRLFRWHLMRDLVHRGYRVVALTPDPTPAVVEALASIQVEVRSIPLARRSLNAFGDVGTLAHLVQEFRTLRPELVLSYTIKPIIYASFAARLAGTPRIYSMFEGLGYAFEDSPRAPSAARSAIRSLLRRAVRCNDGVIFLNDADRLTFESREIVPPHLKRIVVPGTGIDTDYYSPRPLPREPVFAMIARMLKTKGVREYIEAARRFRASGGRGRFLLVGWNESGPNAVDDAAITAASDAGIIERHGPVDDVRPVLEQARFYVLPSYREGLSRTVLEAMSMGRPVISTDVPGCRDAVMDGVTGVLVPARDPGALARAMTMLAEHPDLAERMGAAGRRRVEAEFDVARVNRTLLSFMQVRAAPSDQPLAPPA